MITRNIKCAKCGHEGKVEAHDTIEKPKLMKCMRSNKKIKGCFMLV